jgi:hypothetical protein
VTILGSGLPTLYVECPLPQCPWRMEQTPVDQIPFLGATIKEAVSNGLRAAMVSDDAKVRAHLAEHPVEEWAMAVVKLGDLARATRRAFEVVAEAERWKVVIPGGTLKGITETDARRIAAEHGGEVYRSTVTLYADGSELLRPWERA